MAFRHTILIERAGTGAQDVDGVWTPAGARTVVYSGKGFLYHSFRTRTQTEDRDPAAPSTGELYLKDRRQLWQLQQGDWVQATDPKLRTTVSGRLETVDHLIGRCTVSGIRLGALS